MNNLHDPHPVRNDIIKRTQDYDRAFFKTIPAKAYIRYASNGENPIEHEPFHILIVRQIENGFRTRIASPGMLSVIDDDSMPRLEINVPYDFDGWVYIVKRRDEYKIGMTRNIKQRIDQLRTSHAVEGVIHYILTDNPKKLEKALHRRLASVRMSGEWFRLTDEMIDHIRTIGAVFMDSDPDVLRLGSEYFPLSSGLHNMPGLPFSEPEKWQGIIDGLGIRIDMPDQWPVDWIVPDAYGVLK